MKKGHKTTFFMSYLSNSDIAIVSKLKTRILSCENAGSKLWPRALFRRLRFESHKFWGSHKNIGLCTQFELSASQINGAVTQNLPILPLHNV